MRYLIAYAVAGSLYAFVALTTSGCGVLTSRGHFAMTGDERGIHAVSDMMNGLARAQAKRDEYFRHRRIQTTEETHRETQPGFWSKVFFGGLAAKKPAEYDVDSGS